MTVDLTKLAQFLLRAKLQTYAGEGKEVAAQRPGFKELEYVEGDWTYRDSYAGFFLAPGQEVVRLNRQPVWAMAYCGGMLAARQGDEELATRTFAHLKAALQLVEESNPFRGPKSLVQGDWKYVSSQKGNITDFTGREKIFFQGNEVFKQNYIGGLIIPKV